MSYPNYFQELADRLARIESCLLSLCDPQPQHKQNAEILTAEQLRERLGICKASERSYVQSGILKPQHLGRRVYYRWDEVTTTLSTKSDDFLPSKLRGKKGAVSKQKSR